MIIFHRYVIYIHGIQWVIFHDRTKLPEGLTWYFQNLIWIIYTVYIYILYTYYPNHSLNKLLNKKNTNPLVISHSFRTSAVFGIGFGTSLGHQLPIRLEELVSVRSSRRRFWKSLASEKGERCSLPLGFGAPEKLRPSQGHCNDNVSFLNAKAQTSYILWSFWFIKCRA